jgi:hypothetical protein
MISLLAWRFFFRHAGYSVPPGKAPCAIALARTEQWAENNGIEFRLEDDLDADASFVETWPESDQKRWKETDHTCYVMLCYRPVSRTWLGMQTPLSPRVTIRDL